MLAVLATVPLEVLEQVVTALGRVDAPGIEDERPAAQRISVALVELRRFGGSGRIEAYPDHVLKHPRRREARVHERLFLRGAEDERLRRGEHVAEEREIDRRLIVRSRDEHALAGGEPHALERRGVEVRDINEIVVLAGVGTHEVEEAR